jgi:hypothetical protein
MEMQPSAFWRLTIREFWIKHRAFSRLEDRREAAMIRQALRTVGGYKKADRQALERSARALTRYPVKKWLQQA